jgi:uncharacterized protein (TIGR02001 family)
MNPIRSFLFVLTVFGAASRGPGQTAAPAAGPVSTWTLTPAFVSQYLFRGVRLGGAAFQPTVEYGSGRWVAGVWASVPVADKVPGQSDPEIDFYGSATWALTDAVTLVAGATWYWFPRAENANGFYRSTFEPSLAVNWTVDGFRLTPKVCYDVVLAGPTAEVTAFYAVPLASFGTELDFTATAGTYRWDEAAEDTASAVKNWGDYWSAGVALPFQLTASGKLTVGWAYARGSGNFLKAGTAPRTANPAAVGRGVVSVAYSLTY